MASFRSSIRPDDFVRRSRFFFSVDSSASNTSTKSTRPICTNHAMSRVNYACISSKISHHIYSNMLPALSSVSQSILILSRWGWFINESETAKPFDQVTYKWIRNGQTFRPSNALSTFPSIVYWPYQTSRYYAFFHHNALVTSFGILWCRDWSLISQWWRLNSWFHLRGGSSHG